VKSRADRLEARAKGRAAAKATGKKPIASNRRALHEYEVEEKLEAGLALTGTEVKSLRDGQANLSDGWVGVERGEAWLHDVHVAPYAAGSWTNHEPKRKRKLLLHRREIVRLDGKIRATGATCVPLALYFRGSRVKVEIAVVRGKKLRDKRETIRRREADREARAAIKGGRTL